MRLLQRQKGWALSVIFGEYTGAEYTAYLNGEPVGDLRSAVGMRYANRSEGGTGAEEQGREQELVVTDEGGISGRAKPERDQTSRKEEKR